MTIRFSLRAALQSIMVFVTGVAATVALIIPAGAEATEKPALQNPGMVISQVWDDTNRNGLQDSNESGVPGVTVSLLTCEGAYVMSSVTGDYGAAPFEAEAGCYRLLYEELQNYRYCPSGDGIYSQIDSDVDPATRLSVPFEIAAGSYLIDIDAGIARAPGSQIGDRVWHDQNANGIQDISEPGLPGISLDLLDCAGNVMRDARGARVSVASDEAGNFLFDSVTAGCYRIGVTAATDDLVTAFQHGDGASDSDIEPDTMQSLPFDLAADDARYDLDVGLYRHGRIGDRVWLDVDRDGVQGSADVGMADVLVLLLDESGTPTGVTATTNSNGYYRFGQLKPAAYRLQFVIPDGYAATAKNRGDSDERDSDANSLGISDTFRVSSDLKVPSLDFGLVTRQALALAIDKSTNGDDADEPPGPFIEVGDEITWNYVVTNTGDQTVFDLVVTDDQGVDVSCPDDSLIPGEIVNCTGTGLAVAGQYVNVATARAGDGSDDPVTIIVDDLSHYFGSAPNIWIRKTTNGVDADVPPGPTLPVGSNVNWVYTIENTGNVQLTDISVTDSEGVIVTCPFTALNPGVIMNCTGSGTATIGQYANIGTVTATPPVGAPVTDFDPSHYLGAAVGPMIEKLTNGVDADTLPGPSIPVGETVTWTYQVTNDTPFAITALSVTDNQGVVVVCPQNFLAPGQAIDCTGTGIAAAGQYANVGTVCGTVAEQEYCDADPSHYFGSNPSVWIRKATNGEDADLPPGPSVPVGSLVNWVYTIENTGNVTLSDVTVSDDQGVAIVCPSTTLEPGIIMDCTGSGTAIAGPYANVGTVTGTPPVGAPVSDFDPSHYFGADPGIQIVKYTDGDDANTPPGPSIGIGNVVLWTYEVTNTGNVTLIDVSVTDNRGVAVTCPATTLAPGETIECTGIGTATIGQYSNIGTACGNTGVNGNVTICDDDPSHYFGADRAIQIMKSTNGDDANVAPGPAIRVGDVVTWTYTITNTGNETLFEMSVDDDQGVVVTCPLDALIPDATMTCTGTGIAEAGQYANIGTACGNDGSDNPITVCANDPSHYFGADPAIWIRKTTNGVDADLPPGPTVAVGSVVDWVYTIENTGNVPLTDIAVVDSQGVVVTCPSTTLDPGINMNCTGSGIAVLGQYANTGTVTGTPSAGPPVTDFDPSHYFGADLSLTLDKLTNGVDADAPTGPMIAVGDPVTWTYIVTNTGNVSVSDLTVIDDQGVVVTCPVNALAPGAAVTCTGTGIASAGQYANLGTACANDGSVVPVIACAEDPSHYFGAEPHIWIRKTTNGVDADLPPGPTVAVGAPIDWVYTIENTGNVTLTDIVVTDSQGVAVTCPMTTLDPGVNMNCTGSGIATAGQYANIGTATGTPPVGPPVTDMDPSHYFGAEISIDLQKSTNGVDADTPTGPTITIGDAVTWTYTVTNTGNVTLSDLVVTDDQGVAVTCPATTLAPGASLDCTGTGIATAGQYANLGTACANDGAAAPTMACDSDPSHYFGADLSITVEKATNGVDADTPTGPLITVGDPVNWTYTVTNTGNVSIFELTVTDNQGVVVTCPGTALAPGATVTCTGSGIATTGQYANLGTACANDGSDVPAVVCADDPSHYFGADPHIWIRKTTNGVDANLPPGPTVAVGAPIDWVYTIENTGNVTLSDIVVVDDQGVAVTCPLTTLDPGANMNCTGSGIATAGQYANIGTVTGTPPVGPPVTDLDPSHYFGAEISIDLEKSTNGLDADTPTGPSIAVGDAVNWTYTVTNTGNVTLEGLVVTDNQGVAVTCPVDTLLPGTSTVCTGTGVATQGQYANLGTACANDGAAVPTMACDEDPSHYFGTSLEIQLVKYTNGVDANTPPGPSIPVGGAVTWTYEVTNVGNVTLFDIVVTDNQGVAVTCPLDSLAPGATTICTGTGVATPGQYTNIGMACANDGSDDPSTTCDDDPSHYFGADISINLEKFTNGADADTPTGPTIAIGDAVTWTYTVTNTGNVALSDLVVTDDQGVAVTCPATTLAPGASLDCTGTGIATAGQYANLGTACANDGAAAPTTACDDDPSHYFGADLSITVEKSTNGVDADTPAGPAIPVGAPVTWTYTVTNTGNVTLFDLVVTDDQGVAVTCPVDALIPGASTECTGTGTAALGQYANLGTACASDGADVPSTVCDTDPSHYFGADISIDLEKFTNGVDADTPSGPTIAVGDAVTWTYTVTNTGNVTLSDLVVTDNQGVAVTCPATTLAPGASLDCTGTGIATAGQYANLGTACANDGAAVPTAACDDDPSHYFGADLSIDLEKSTNGVDADTPTGPSIPVGAPVNWTYTVTNTGNVTLFDLALTDDQGVAVTCPVTSLAPGATTTCTGTGTATIGQYANLGTACANDGADVPSTVCDTDPSHYFGSNLDVQIIKYTNGADANTPPGPAIMIGDPVTWTYEVTNIGNVSLFDLVVTDDQGVAVTCAVDALAPGATTTCTGTGVATAGQYANIGMVCGNDGADVPTTTCDDDPSHYFGADLSIDLEKSTNGVDADTPTGPSIPVGAPVNWTYTVTNTGNVTLFDLALTDDQGVAVTCPVTSLAPGATTICTGTGTATIGQYANLGTACANDGADVPSTVCDTDPSHYFGSNLDVQIIKYTNGADANTPPGPAIMIGDPVTWTYEVTNIGNVSLFDLVVTDNQGVAVTCPVDALAPGATTVCTGTGIATLGQYANLGTVCGNDGSDVPTTVCDDDPSHYFGTLIAIDLEKSTNGNDADTPSGPAIMVGDPVTWTYTVTNTGNVSLFNVVLNDDQGVAITCPADALAPGASFDCTGTGIAAAGQYANIGAVCANDGADVPTTVCADDPSHYFGVLLAIDLEKATNGEDADTPTGPMIATGDAVNWTYTVTNTGNITLFDLVVTDDQGVAVSCPLDALAPGASMICTGTGTAAQGQYANLGTVCGNDGADVPSTVCADDPSHYFGLACEVSVDATCLIPSPPATDYVCKKPIDSLTFIWNGAAPVRIKAWKGAVGSTLLADLDNIAPGQEITVNGFAGSPNNVWYELFNAGTNTKIGESQFHLSCSDDDMDGPEDCGKAAGDGKDNSSHFINDWLLEGIVDDGGVLDCTPPAVTGSDSCTFNPVPVSCDTVNSVDTITLRYTGGSCADSQNNQGSKFDCSGSVNGALPVLVELENGNQFTVNPDELFTSPEFGSGTEVILSNAGGTMLLNIHTSCSAPLETGDVYGATTLIKINDMGIGTDVIYGYKVTNNGVRPLINLSVVDIPLGPVPGVPSTLNPGEMVTLFNTAFVDMTTTNTVIVNATDSAGAMCDAQDMVTVSLPPPPACFVSNAPDHGFWMADFNADGNVDKFDFDAGATFNRMDDGTATLTGIIRDQGSAGRAFEVSLVLSGLTPTPPPGSPKNNYGYNTSDWQYYPVWSGTMTGIESYAGAELDISRRGPAFQIGTGANDQPDQASIFGASGWLDWDTLTQADACATNSSRCIADTGDGDVNIVLNCDVQGPPCNVTGEGFLDIDKDKIKWNIENVGSATATIQSITLTWPEDVHGDLKEIKLDGDRFFDMDTSGGSVTLGPGDWTGNADKREIKAGDVERLEFVFQDDNNGVYGADAYSIRVNFEEGCSVTFVNTGAPFACVKPIRELSMIWDGAPDPVRVKAWKGSVGSDLLLDQSGIANGSKVTVPGYAGSPNDVFWEIFSGGSKIGESKFHLSCSDDDMDGSEDCGKRQGNGKSNDSGFINDWLLDGMVDQVGAFDCTP